MVLRTEVSSLKTKKNDNRMRCSMDIGRFMRMALAMMAATMVAAAQDLSFEGLLKDGIRSYNNGDYKTAAENFGEAGKLRPDDARVKYNEALSYYRNGDMTEANKCFQDALGRGWTENEAFKASCKLGIGNSLYNESKQI